MPWDSWFFADLILSRMADQPPFQHFFATLGQGSPFHAPDVNAAAAVELERTLVSPLDGPGRGILLRAPRAGFGKTHLIARVHHRLASTHEFLPLVPLDGSRIEAAGAIESALRRLTRQLPAGNGLTALDLQARRIFSVALQPLVASGEVPCQDREAALSALRLRPVETFDFHQPQAVTAHWTKENFEVLGPRLALELSRSTSSPLNETSFWLATLFRYAAAVPEHPGRGGMIVQSAVSDASVERFAALLALLSLIERVVLVADDLEGLHGDPAAALRLASFLAAVRQDAPRVDTIVSLNDDIWTSAFEPALSGGLQDRLAEIEIRLGSLSDDALAALLEARLPGRGAALLEGITLGPEERYARRALRLAAARAPAAFPSPAGRSQEEPQTAPGEPEAEKAVPEGETEEQVSVAETGREDRIDDLLRQFRDRYGRD